MIVERPAVLSLFDVTAHMVEPWVAADYECWIVDIQHPRGIHRGDDGIVRVGIDLMRWLPPLKLANRLVAAFAFPPCTDLANSGNAHKRSKGLGVLTQSLSLIDRTVQLLEWLGVPYLMENPVGSISTYWRKPDRVFDPCDFGGYLAPPTDRYTKRTCLWTGHGFVMPKSKPVKPEQACETGSWIMRLGGSSATTKNARSATPRGFAQAVYEANAPEPAGGPELLGAGASE